MNSLRWGGWREIVVNVCWGCFVLFFGYSFTSLRVLRVFCEGDGSVLILKCDLLHLQGERVKQGVNGEGLSLVAPHHAAPQLSATSSDD